MPPSISLWDAAAPDDSLAFLLVGAAILLPIILAYTAYALLGLPRQGHRRGALPLTAKAPDSQPKGRWSRFGWFVLLWACGVAVVSALGYVIRLVLLG